MSDNEDKKGFNFDKLNTPLTVFATIMVALIGFYGNQKLNELNGEIQRGQLEVSKLQLHESQEKEKYEFIAKYAQLTISEKEKERQIAIALILLRYPKDAQRLFERINDSLPIDSKLKVDDSTIKKAEQLKTEIDSWGVVISSDTNLAEAKPEMETAISKGYKQVKIYKRGGLFATVILYPNLPNKPTESELSGVRANLRDGIFPVNIKEWCLNPTQKEGVTECTNS
jgi:hypothetical protein